MIPTHALFGVVGLGSSWLAYPFTLGLVAAVNPCGFPLLPIYLGMFVEGGETGVSGLSSRIARAMAAGVLATCGFVVVFGVIGLISVEGISSTYSTTSSWARWVMVGLGVLMAVLGVASLLGRDVRLPHLSIRPGLGIRRPIALVFFGVSYAIASLGCALPLFIGGVAGVFTRSGTTHGIGTFLAYALGMGLLLTVAALVMAFAGSGALRHLRVASRFVRPLGGTLVLLVGSYVALYWIVAIVDPTGSLGVIRAVESLQSHVATFVQSEAGLFALLGGSLLVVVLVLLGVSSRPVQVSPRDGVSK